MPARACVNALAIFSGPYALLAKWGVIAALLAAFGGWCWVKGNEHGTEKLTEYIGKEAAARVVIVTKQGAVTEKIITRYVKVAGKTEVVTQTVEKEVVRYAEANPGYCLDVAWGRLYDAAAANTVPEPAGHSDGAERAPTAAGALEAVTASYAACHRTADKLDALQAWVIGQSKVVLVK